MIAFARPVRQSDSSLIGVLVVTTQSGFFTPMLQAAADATGGAATLRSAGDYALIARHPMSDQVRIGSRELTPGFLEHVASRPQAGRYFTVSIFDGVKRANGYRRLQRYPFIVTVGVDRSQHMDDWWRFFWPLAGLIGRRPVFALCPTECQVNWTGRSARKASKGGAACCAEQAVAASLMRRL